MQVKAIVTFITAHFDGEKDDNENVVTRRLDADDVEDQELSERWGIGFGESVKACYLEFQSIKSETYDSDPSRLRILLLRAPNIPNSSSSLFFRG